jgi:hypothetical protein
MRRVLRVLVTLVIALFAFGYAEAELITWTLNDVRFDDGGTASGYFSIDPDHMTVPSDPRLLRVANFDITTTAGSVFVASHYTPKSVAFPPILFSDPSKFSISFCNCPPDINPTNYIVFIDVNADILSSRGTFPILTATSQEFVSVPGTRRFVTEGTMTGVGPIVPRVFVPEPASANLLSLGVLLLILLWSMKRAVGSPPPARHREPTQDNPTR